MSTRKPKNVTGPVTSQASELPDPPCRRLSGGDEWEQRGRNRLILRLRPRLTHRQHRIFTDARTEGI
jgi:hypothetical protein